MEMINFVVLCCSVMVQFHGLGVLHQIRKSDKLAVTKMVSKLTSSGMRSPYAICLLVKFLLCSKVSKYVCVSAHIHTISCAVFYFMKRKFMLSVSFLSFPSGFNSSSNCVFHFIWLW